ncbi:MAG: 3-isopropylmalate dehydratase small subunit [Alphaproteobacteria bacterium]|nr:MAG: 3-isopropylmalate dehydratase small subunit [Alphaproteobacteria bacterium]
MQAFTNVTAIPIPLVRDNIDTDIIIPARYLKTVSRKGLGEGAFYTLRHRDDGIPDPASPFNQARFKDSAILVAGDNFGCGSSREHAAWALVDLGIRVVIAESFADIFDSNAFKNGILTVTLPRPAISRIAAEGEAGRAVEVSLEECRVRLADGTTYGFEIDPFRRRCLLEGLDEVALTLAEHGEAIAAFEAEQRERAPWLWETPTNALTLTKSAPR